jgi:hypothetical protein
MAYYVLMAKPHDFESTAAGDLVRHVLWRIYPVGTLARMIDDVVSELERRWPGYVIRKEDSYRDFSIHQHTGQAVATVAIIAQSLP